MRLLGRLIAGLLFTVPVFAREPLIQVAPAGAATIRLATEPRGDDPLTQAAKRAADDPWPNAGTMQILEAAHTRDQQEWEQVFAIDLGQAFRGDAVSKNVPFEYQPNPYAMPDGFSIVQLLANAVLRANLPCGSIYAVDSLGDDMHGWALMCDKKANFYAVTLVGKHWKLARITPNGAQSRTPSRK